MATCIGRCRIEASWRTSFEIISAEALSVVAVAFHACFGLTTKFPGSDDQLADARAPDSRIDASRFFVCFDPLFLFIKENRKI